MTDLRPEFLGATRSRFFVDSRVLLLGEDNPQNSEPKFALFPVPAAGYTDCAGRRLRDVVIGCTKMRYLSTWRTNLCHEGKWSLTDARARFNLLTTLDDAPWDTVVMLGTKVRGVAEFCLRKRDAWRTPMVAYDATAIRRTAAEPAGSMPYAGRPLTLVAIPHPSGRNPEYNNPENVRRARDLLSRYAPELYAPDPVRVIPSGPELTGLYSDIE